MKLVILFLAFVALSTAFPVEHLRIGDKSYAIHPYIGGFNSRIQRENGSENDRRFGSQFTDAGGPVGNTPTGITPLEKHTQPEETTDKKKSFASNLARKLQKLFS